VPEWSNGVDCKSIVRRFESYPALKIGACMNIRQLVSKLEEIERLIDGKAKDLCWDLIEELIEIDMEMENKIKRVVDKNIEEDFIKFLMTEGIASGSIGEA
jgi:chemotaxis regulatin CheY-phosphate phosphatase CheZ